MAAPQQKAPADDGPDLEGIAPADTITLSRDDLAAMIAEEVAEQTRVAKQEARSKVVSTTVVPANPHLPPAEPTYEPAFIPTADDFAAANRAAERGELVDEPVPVGPSIEAIAPDGSSIFCSPKAFRTLYAARGYVAHPDDARRGLRSEARPSRRRRGGGNIVGSEPTEQESATSRRRRRRSNDD